MQDFAIAPAVKVVDKAGLVVIEALATDTAGQLGAGINHPAIPLRSDSYFFALPKLNGSHKGKHTA